MSHNSKGPKGAAAKGKKASKSQSADNDDQEDVLQAVILADSFQDRFMPFAIEKPRCLLPLANTPLLEYTLEFLSSNGVKEVYIYCGAHIDQVETYVKESPRWSPSSRVNPFEFIEFIRVADARSMGDFLRDLDKRGKITGDFVLVHGDVVSNINLDNVIAEHKARREANRDAIMTMVLRSGGMDDHRTKIHGSTPVFVVDPTTKRCLAYDEVNPLQSDRYVILDPEVLKNPELEMRADLIDPGIDICTPDVLALWSESFDYELPRRNFLHGVLKDWELNGKLIYADILEKGYAARASNLQMYDAISRDILSRWTFPMVPDCNLFPGQSYLRKLNGVSAENDVVASNSAKLRKCIVGKHSSFGDNASVTNSFIGRRCKIGKNVTIRNSFIWDEAVIGDNTTVDQSIIANSAVVGSNCNIPIGSLISFGIRISDDIKLAKETVLSLMTREGIHVAPDTALLGPAGKGAIYLDSLGEDEAALEDPASLQKSLIYSLTHLNLSAESVSTFNSHADSDSDDDELTTPSAATQHRSRLSSFASDDESRTNNAFHADAVNGLLDTLRKEGASQADMDSAKLEFMGLRLANDASDVAMRRAVTAAFARRAAELLLGQGSEGALEPSKAAVKTIGVPGAAKFIKEVAVSEDDVPEQVEFILALQKALLAIRELQNVRAGVLLSAMIQHFYNADVLEEDGILAWWSDARGREGDGMVEVREMAKPVVEWLQQADEDDDDDEEESEDDD